jgi:hypothetical protein
MRANRCFRLIVRRGGLMPAALADPGRVDHVEVVEIASGEVLLFWDMPPVRASRLARALRADLAQLDAEAFRTRWLEPHAGARAAPASGGHDWLESDASV